MRARFRTGSRNDQVEKYWFRRPAPRPSPTTNIRSGNASDVARSSDGLRAVLHLEGTSEPNYNDKKTIYDGGKTVTVAAALGSLPLFVREGAIIPRGDVVKLNNNWDANWSPKLRIEIFPSSNGGNEFNYLTGSKVEVRLYL